MGWSEIWKVVLGVVTSVGGVGIIIVACAKFASGMIATRLEQKYSLKIEKDLEAYKTELEKDFEGYKQGLSKEMERYRTSLAAKNYVSKTRFDAEFEIYRNLSLAYFEMIKMITNLIPPGLANRIADEKKESERVQKLYLQSNDATIAAQDNQSPCGPWTFRRPQGLLLFLRIEMRIFNRDKKSERLSHSESVRIIRMWSR